MNYRGLINIDFTNIDNNQYQKLVAALIQLGWVYVETSAFILDAGQDLPLLLRSLDLIARQCQWAGQLSALTIHIQGSEDFDGIPYPAAGNHRNAVSEIQSKPLPPSIP